MTTAKRGVAGLAALGGTPLFARPLHVGQPNIGNRRALMRRFRDILDSRWLTNNGPYVQEFERKVAALAGTRHCVAVCNATVGLEIAIRALGLHGEVIVPSFTFIATAHALKWQEITPVFADISADDNTLDPADVERRITSRTTGIIGVHLWGRACNVDALAAIARTHRLKLLFDAAHAVGCSYRGRPLGQFGHAEVFSFHATKLVNSFEGGAVTTNDDDLAERMRLMRNFGFSGYDNVIHIGTNGKMAEVSAAMGITSLEQLPALIKLNRRNYRRYTAGLAGIPGLLLRDSEAGDSLNFQYVPVVVGPELGLTRDEFVGLLQAENILARRYFYPGCHRMEPYRSDARYQGTALPVTESLADSILCLPTGSSIGLRDIDRICGLVRFIARNAGEIRTRLAPASSRRATP